MTEAIFVFYLSVLFLVGSLLQVTPIKVNGLKGQLKASRKVMPPQRHLTCLMRVNATEEKKKKNTIVF